MVNKRGQGAGPAAGLVAIIAIIIVLYVMFLPPEVREGLLNETETSASSSSSRAAESNILVIGHPGLLDPTTETDREKALDSFNLYSEKSAVVLSSVQAAHVENGWLTEKIYNLTFSVEDLTNTENYVVAFDAATSSGRLKVSLNGKEIYDSVVPVGNAEPIALDKKDIKNENSLVFSVSSVGMAFWKLNEYDLKNIRVIADFTDKSKREYKNFFIITATEKQYFKETKLTFVPDCMTPRELGPLTIAINGKQLHYSAIPDCGMPSIIPFDPNYLVQGENSITFRADKGTYFIDRVKIKAELKEMTYPFYYFELTQKEYTKVRNNTANVTLEIKFADKEDKQGELNVNGHLSDIDTDNSTYIVNLKRYVQEEQNSLQIKPITILNIVDLKVTLDK